MEKHVLLEHILIEDMLQDMYYGRTQRTCFMEHISYMRSCFTEGHVL